MELSEQHIVDNVIARLIENDLEIFKTMISKAQTAQTSKNSTDSTEPVPDHSKIQEKITELVKRKLYKTKPNSDQLFYKTDFEVCGLSDILYNIASILKISIIALENTYSGDDRQIHHFHNTIRNSLDLVLQLLPFEEVECLEEIIEAYGLPNDVGKKE